MACRVANSEEVPKTPAIAPISTGLQVGEMGECGEVLRSPAENNLVPADQPGMGGQSARFIEADPDADPRRKPPAGEQDLSCHGLRQAAGARHEGRGAPDRPGYALGIRGCPA